MRNYSVTAYFLPLPSLLLWNRYLRVVVGDLTAHAGALPHNVVREGLAVLFGEAVDYA
jgi:hypothetical protein